MGLHSHRRSAQLAAATARYVVVGQMRCNDPPFRPAGARENVGKQGRRWESGPATSTNPQCTPLSRCPFVGNKRIRGMRGGGGRVNKPWRAMAFDYPSHSNITCPMKNSERASSQGPSQDKTCYLMVNGQVSETVFTETRKSETCSLPT